jgi:hypothetical protein
MPSRAIIAFLDQEEGLLSVFQSDNPRITPQRVHERLAMAVAQAADDGDMTLGRIVSEFHTVKGTLFEECELQDAILPPWADLQVLIWVFAIDDAYQFQSREEWASTVPSYQFSLLDLVQPDEESQCG